MTSTRTVARRILLFALGIGMLVDVALVGSAAGLNASIVMLAMLAAAFIVAGEDGLRRMDVADAWLPIGALVFAAMPAIRADDWLVQADLLLAALLGAGSIACLAGARITRGAVPAVLALAIGLMASAVIGAATVVRAATGRRASTPAGDAGAPATGDASRAMPGRGTGTFARLAPAVPIARGLLLAIPVLALFALLFASADAVFAALARSALDWRLDIDLGNVAERTVVVTGAAWIAAGLLALAAGLLPEMLHGHAAPDAMSGPPAGWGAPGPRSLGAASAADLATGPRLGTVEAATVLSLVAALFAGFVVLQLAYLFGGRDTLAVTGLTYAEYARRGFFELVAVAILAGMLVVTLDLAVGRRSRGQLVASLVLLALTGVVLLSAFVRLRLYQDMYGWTELRFVVVVAIGWLAVALGLAAGLILARASQWTLHVLGIAVLVTIAAMNVVGPQAFVADRNIERAVNPALVAPGGRTGLDAWYLASLGDEAIPSVVAAYPSLPADARAQLDDFLVQRRIALATDPRLQGWPAWNLTRERARAALAGWEAPSGR